MRVREYQRIDFWHGRSGSGHGCLRFDLSNSVLSSVGLVLLLVYKLASVRLAWLASRGCLFACQVSQDVGSARTCRRCQGWRDGDLAKWQTGGGKALVQQIQGSDRNGWSWSWWRHGPGPGRDGWPKRLSGVFVPGPCVTWPGLSRLSLQTGV